MNKIINIDWLQLNCRGIAEPKNNYIFKKLPYQTRHFKNIYEIFINDKIFCTLACCPLSPIIPKDTNLIKIVHNILLLNYNLTY